jgi:putative endonuclease
MKKWYVYLIQCIDGSLYCGITLHLKDRIKLHNDGLVCNYTKERRPVHLVVAKYGFCKRDACYLEDRIREMKKEYKVLFLENL